MLFYSGMEEEIILADSNAIFSDYEYIIMTEIMENENVTQRELSRKLGVSVSTVNVLMNKMIRKGIVKMTQVSQKQVFYMLTPEGMVEKANKTVRFLKIHYRAIYETKEKIKDVFEKLAHEHDAIIVVMNDDDISEIMGIAIDEFGNNHRKPQVIAVKQGKHPTYKDYHSPILVHMGENEEVLREYIEAEGLTVINLAERW